MDLAGNNFTDARPIGGLTAQPKTFRDSVGQRGQRNQFDLYRFKLGQRGSFHMSLSQLTANANADLISRTGKLLARSDQARANSEALSKTLETGVYYLKVYSAKGKDTTQYQLRLAASNAANLPVITGGALPGDRWLYQLQNASIQKINATSFDLLTIDYSKNGSDSGRYTPAELQSLQSAGKNVLGYLSIGEAEEYRDYYFQDSWVKKAPGSELEQPIPGSAPDWLDRTNRAWEGNYKVKYWSRKWQTIVLNSLDRIIDAGFNGVYLDIVDAFEYWSDQEQLDNAGSQNQKLGERDAAQRMIKFVERIAYHARVMRGKTDFQIVPQNGEAILAYDQGNRYLQTINGIGIEDLFYDELTPQQPADVQERLKWLDQIKGNGKTVLSVDYVDDGTGRIGMNGDRINDFLTQAQSRGYLPYAALNNRELNNINGLDDNK